MKNRLLLFTVFFAQSFMAIAQNDISISARGLSSEECVATFGINFHEYAILPVKMSITNTTNKVVTLLSEDIKIGGAKLITPQVIEDMIHAKYLAGSIFWPLGLLLMLEAVEGKQNLSAIKPIIKNLSIADGLTIIYPGQTVETMLFPEFIGCPRGYSFPNSKAAYLSMKFTKKGIIFNSTIVVEQFVTIS